MKKVVSIIVSALIAVVAIADIFWFFNQKSTSTSSVVSNTTTNTSSSISSTASSGSSSTTGAYKDGTYTGSTVSTQWGNVQVEVTISGGKITNVVFLKSTSDDGNSKSTSIDDVAQPEYISEAKTANSASIQAVSGATVTYDGFTESLQNALTQAV
ncbi:MAG: FMN-binding protein [Streptococcaceae bacterium]|jgi:uncharacterized protein with FMN-binding domain|nr:FMN-binding protein [Streptococcaceae bacterium]